MNSFRDWGGLGGSPILVMQAGGRLRFLSHLGGAPGISCRRCW